MNQMMSWCPPPPGCGPGWLEQCYNDTQAVEALLIKIINDILAKDPNAFGHVGALKGVVDGSSAAPGNVGEIVSFPGTAPFAANANFFVTLTTMGTLPAGDWNVAAWIGTSAPISYILLDNVPTTNLNVPDETQLIPPGWSFIGLELSVTAATDTLFLPTNPGWARTAGPTSVILRTVVNSGATPGQLNIGFAARRMR